MGHEDQPLRKHKNILQWCHYSWLIMLLLLLCSCILFWTNLAHYYQLIQKRLDKNKSTAVCTTLPVYSRLCFLKMLGSFNMYSWMLHMSAMAGVFLSSDKYIYIYIYKIFIYIYNIYIYIYQLTTLTDFFLRFCVKGKYVQISSD